MGPTGTYKNGKKLKIALICMPFSSPYYPSIQLGILKPILVKAGYDVSNFYLNLDFAKKVGVEFYEKISKYGPTLMAEWVFSASAFGLNEKNASPDLLIDAITKKYLFLDTNDTIAKLHDVRKATDGWLDEITRKVDWKGFDVIGFSCCYAQTTASIAFTKRLKAMNPGAFILFGGNALDGSIGEEIATRVESIDCVIQGEGEKAITELLKEYEIHRKVPRVYSSRIETDLNAVPLTDYDEYYAAVDNDEMYHDKTREGLGTLLYESSRGCWWTKKSKCLFCGLNKDRSKYREKNINKILDEIPALTKKYNNYNFFFVDSVLNEKYFGKLFPHFVEKKTSYKFFFEVRPSLSFEKIRMLKDIGCVAVQPGIESLNTEILRIMRKGVTATQNIEFLKWCRFFGIKAHWNFLYCIPGEKEEHYLKMLDLVPKLAHLEPPEGVGPVRLEKYCDLYKENSNGQCKTNFIRNIDYPVQYEACYPSDWNMLKIASYYVGDMDWDVSPNTHACLMKEFAQWINLWNRKDEEKPKLKLKKGLGYAHVVDTRKGMADVSLIDGDYLDVAVAMEFKSMKLKDVAKITKINEKRCYDILLEFNKRGWVLDLDDKYLWLPIPEKI